MQSSERPLPPTRTLFITGFRDSEELEAFKSSKIPSDKIFESYSIPNTNFLFLIFYDVRDSMKFRAGFSSENLQIHHTISKYEIPKKIDECGESNYQSTVCFLFKDIEMIIEDAFIVNFLKQYGEVRELKSTKPQQKIIEFYDFRAAKKAYDTLNESCFGTGTVQCKWMWDLSLINRTEYLKQTDDLLRSFKAPVATPTPAAPQAEPPSKRVKTTSNSGKNPFISIFDDFIAENIAQIEKIIKPK